jgi:hypothetical protein
MMETIKIRDWLRHFQELVRNSSFDLTVVEGILYSYVTGSEEVHLRYLTGDAIRVSDSIGNFLYVRYDSTGEVVYKKNKTIEVPLVVVAGLPFTKDTRKFVELLIQDMRQHLVIAEDINVKTHPFVVAKDELNIYPKKDFPLISASFTLIVPQTNIVCTFDELDCDTSNTLIS